MFKAFFRYRVLQVTVRMPNGPEQIVIEAWHAKAGTFCEICEICENFFFIWQCTEVSKKSLSRYKKNTKKPKTKN